MYICNYKVTYETKDNKLKTVFFEKNVCFSILLNAFRDINRNWKRFPNINIKQKSNAFKRLKILIPKDDWSKKFYIKPPECYNNSLKKWVEELKEQTLYDIRIHGNKKFHTITINIENMNVWELQFIYHVIRVSYEGHKWNVPTDAIAEYFEIKKMYPYSNFILLISTMFIGLKYGHTLHFDFWQPGQKFPLIFDHIEFIKNGFTFDLTKYKEDELASLYSNDNIFRKIELTNSKLKELNERTKNLCDRGI